jgi:hypothetical protein
MVGQNAKIKNINVLMTLMVREMLGIWFAHENTGHCQKISDPARLRLTRDKQLSNFCEIANTLG